MTPGDFHFRPKFFDQMYLGEVWRSEEIIVFFGSGAATFADLQRIYPDFLWARGKQTHSNIVLSASDLLDRSANPSRECDGVISKTQGVAAMVATADCIPLLAWDSRLGISLALHAGWRGVANRIVDVALQRFLSEGSHLGDIFWWIGPHIQGPSFEVGADVAEKLIRSAPNGEKALLPHPVSGKAKVSLGTLAALQIQERGAPGNVWTSSIDTWADPRFASFRRDGQSASRQLSFIGKLR